MGLQTNNDFPSQKKKRSQKNDQWRRNCVDGAENLAVYASDSVRTSFINKRINYDLYSDILDQADVEKICNPMGTLGMKSAAKMQNYPICNPKIDLLVGESIDRRFDWKIRVVNDDAISDKEEDLLKRFQDLMTAHISNDDDEEKIKEDLKKFQQFADFEYQDHRERTSTHIMQYLHKSLRLDYMFSKGFKDALICSEEAYIADIVAGEPVVRKLNPKNINTVRSGESSFMEDSDIINIMNYMSPGQIIDEFHEYLTASDIDQIENFFSGSSNASGSKKQGIDIGYFPDMPLNNAVSLSSLANNTGFGSSFDELGNIRVSRNYWKSMRQVKKVKFYDENGDEQYDIFDEDYKIDKDKGEEETIFWISEWWEGTKIGGSISDQGQKGIYVRMRPKPVQFRSMENPSKCHPGIVGTIYNTNDNTGVSLMDRMKPYQYLYNVLAYNTELAIAKNYGKIMRIDLASIPEHWSVDKWMSFAQGMNAAFYDSFKEGNKGAAQGKLAGTMNQNSPIIDMEMGNTIQLYMNMMAFIKQELGEISGVSQSRQGSIQSRQAVGNTQTEMTQSSHITEYWFLEHEETKLRVMNMLLDTAKHAWRDIKNKKVQHVLDDGSTVMLNIDVEEFRESEYGLVTSNGADGNEILQTMKQLAHAGIQTGAMNFSQLLDIYSTDSLSSIRRKIERSEREKQETLAKDQERQAEMNRENNKAAASEADKAREFVREGWDREDSRNLEKLNNNIEIERMRQDNIQSSEYDPGVTGTDGRESLAALKVESDRITREHNLKLKEHAETVRHNKADEATKLKMANKKPTSGK